MAIPEDTNGWSKSEMYVMDKLEAHDKRLDSIDARLESLAVKVATLAGVASLIGTILARYLPKP